ncbi:MAG: tetratricopeptide repeat protein, partial [Methyloprofundus sp.]|nr:tetratricopeptide repeat protein [Methyloprofundus sp.]
SVPHGSLEPEQQQLIVHVTEEYRQSLLFSTDRPEAQLALAQLYRQQGKLSAAETAFKEALRLQPQYVPATINYANFLQQQQNESASFEILQQGLKFNKNASLYHALGLWYVRNQDKAQGIVNLQKAAELSPELALHQYVYAIAIYDQHPKQAIQVLEAALQHHTGNIQLLTALASYYQELGETTKSAFYRNKAESVMQYKPEI